MVSNNCSAHHEFFSDQWSVYTNGKKVDVKYAHHSIVQRTKEANHETGKICMSQNMEELSVTTDE